MIKNDKLFTYNKKEKLQPTFVCSGCKRTLPLKNMGSKKDFDGKPYCKKCGNNPFNYLL